MNRINYTVFVAVVKGVDTHRETRLCAQRPSATFATQSVIRYHGNGEYILREPMWKLKVINNSCLPADRPTVKPCEHHFPLIKFVYKGY